MRHMPTDWRVGVAWLAALAFGGLVWFLMHWAERRWNRDTPRKRRLPR